MSDPTELIRKEVEKHLAAGQKYVKSKKTRGMFFLIISVIIVLGINSVLPLIEGQTRYTVDPMEVTYEQYEAMKDHSDNFSLTHKSEKNIDKYIEEYLEEHPELTEEQKIEVGVPHNFKVKVYTKFFFQYTFWYMSTATSLASSVILFYALFNYLLIGAKDKSKEYNDLNEALETMSNTVLDPITFEPWTENVFNYNRKYNQHKSNVKYDIGKLERRTPYRIKRKFENYFKADALDREAIMDSYLVTKKRYRWSKYETTFHNLSWRELRYIRKKERLLSLLDESYIYNYAMHGKVKFFKYIHPMFIMNGTNEEGRAVDSYSLVKSDSEQISNDAAKKVTISLTLTVMFSVLFTVTAISSIGKSPLWIIANILGKLAPLLIQIPMAMDYKNVFMKNQVIKNLRERRNIGLRYAAEVKAKIDLTPPKPPVVDPAAIPTEVSIPYTDIITLSEEVVNSA